MTTISAVNTSRGTFEADGQTYRIQDTNIKGLANLTSMSDSEVIALLENVDLSSLEPVSDTFSSSSTIDVSGSTSEELEEMKADLEAERQETLNQMTEIEAQIEKLIEKAEKLTEDALAKQEAQTEEYQEEAKAVVKQQMQAYVAANKEGGQGMTREQLQSNITGALPNCCSEMTEIFNSFTEANGLLDEVDSYIGDLRSLIEDVKSFDTQISALDNSIETAKAAEEAAAASASCCDPIGFETEDGSRYDFIVDDGAFDSTSDFLGAEDQWAAMQALDTSGDGIVDADELSAANIKMVKTDANGNQSVVDIAEEFGEDFSVDLSSYQNALQADYNGTLDLGDDDGDGAANQTLLGTFNVNIDGESIQGYNTFDDVDWLADNYGIENANETAAADSSSTIFSDAANMHEALANMYQEQSEALREKLNAGYEKFDLTEEELSEFDAALQAEADKNAAEFISSLSPAEEEDGETTETPETTEGAEVDPADPQVVDEDLLLEQ